MDLTMTAETVKPICSVFLATFIFGMCVTRASDPGPIEVWIQLVPDGTTQTIKAEKADPNGVFWDENFGPATSGAFNGGFISTNSKSGWPFVGMGSSGEFDTLAYGLYRFYEPEVSGDTLYVDFRSCNWVVESFPVGSPDFTLEYLISDNKFRCGADTECRGDPPFDNNEIVGIWQLKEEIEVQDVECFRPTDPSNLSISIYDNNPRLSWTASDPSSVSEYHVHREWCRKITPKFFDCQGWEQITASPTGSTTYTDREVYYDPDGDKFRYKIRAIIDNWVWSSGYSNIKETHGWWQKIALNPDRYKLLGNFPNPFNPITKIKYTLPRDSHVSITVYDVSGRKVRTLVNGMKPAGYWSVIWDGKSYTGAGVGTGIYVVKMQSGDFRSTRKLMLIQ